LLAVLLRTLARLAVLSSYEKLIRMMHILKGSLFFAAAQGVAIRGSPDNKLVVVDDSCPIDAPVANFFGAFSFQVPDNKDLVVMKANSTKAGKEPTDAQRAEMKAAMEEYKTVQAKMQKATENMMVAMENMLEVPAMNKTKLTAMLDKKDKDTFIAFYAPWCPHCQTFVLHDGKGNPEKAPLEMFSKEMKARGADKTLNVVRWDVSKYKDVPSQFKVQYIPAMYLAAADGTVTPFKGQGTSAALVKFIEEKSTKTKKIAPLALR
jgi:thioredoxin-like negative regulator of GroEL